MKRSLIFSCAAVAIATLVAGSNAQAQRCNNNRTTIRNNHRITIQPSLRYLPPGSDGSRTGSYYSRNGTYYYNPSSFSSGRVVQVAPEKVAYGSFSHVDDLIARLETLSNDFCLEIYYNYSHNRGFDEIYREAYQILEIVKYIHEEEHHGHRDEISKELGRLDSLFHHVEEDVANWRHNRGRNHHRGHASKKDELLQSMASIIHHLMHDVGVQSRNAPVPGGVAPAPQGAAPVRPLGIR